MTSLLRRHLVVVDAAFLLAAAFLAAKIAGTFAGAALTANSLPTFTHDSPQAGAPPRPRLDGSAISRLTGLELDVGSSRAGSGVAEQPASGPMPTTLNLRLSGTLVANQPQWSMAAIEDLASGESRVCIRGDHIQGAEVIGIERLRVVLRNVGREEYLDLEERSVALPAALGPPSRSSAASLTVVDGSHYRLTRQTVADAMSLERLSEVRVVPAFENGRATGWKVFSIRPGSLLSQLGLENGDVLARINGFEIDSPDKALEVYAKLRQASRVELELVRRGARMRKTVDIGD